MKDKNRYIGYPRDVLSIKLAELEDAFEELNDKFTNLTAKATTTTKTIKAK